MSIIQRIREKYAAVSIAVIALSLVGFILMDALSSRTQLFSGNKTTVGSVNGNKIDAAEFSNKVTNAENTYRARGQQVNDETRQQIIDEIWRSEIQKQIMDAEYEKLGIDFTSADISNLLYGNNPPQDFAQAFTDPKTGLYDANAARQRINSIRKKKETDPERVQIEGYIDYLIQNGKLMKYNALINGSIFYPQWLNDKDIQDQNSIASMSYVSVPYSTISDSTIKVSDDDINKYVKNHKNQFKQEESRTISFAMFDAAPSAQDTAALISSMKAKVAEFSAMADVKQFLAKESSEFPYYDGYVGSKENKQPLKDTLFRLSPGQLFGPYPDNGTYVVAKMIAKTTIPDTVKVRHILVATVQRDPQTGASYPVRQDSVAKKRIDSVVTFISNGQKWDSVCINYSDDPGSKDKGGVYENIVSGGMVSEFNDFIFTGKTGERKIVKTEFGYHYIEIMSQKGSQAAHKIAYLSKTLLPSDETINNANTAATQFASEARNAKQFEEVMRKKNLFPRIAEVKPTDNYVNGVGNARRLVRWIYENKVGTVSEPESFGDKFIVALITEEKEEGLPNAKAARVQVENIVRNQKKAEQIIQKIGNSRDMNAIATTYKTTVQRADSVSFSAPFLPAIGMEPKVVGAAFNPSYKTKVSEPIPGAGGVFLVGNTTVGAKPSIEGDYTARRQQMEMQMKQTAGSKAIDALRKAAKIKDERINFY
jgi:peptidyl-prolyl cis-trans isomerase D